MRFPATPVWAVLSLICAANAAAQEARPFVASQGQSSYTIVVADDASPSTRHAAEELQTFLEQMTGAKLPIASDKTPATANEIVLGKTNSRLAAISPKIEFDSLGLEGYVIRTVGAKLVIAGGEPRGTLYGVYGLLEDHWGCRWFAPGVSRIPQAKQLPLPSIDERKTPILEYREPFTFDCFDGDWCARNRVNSGSGRLEAKHGGKMRISSLCHTFAALVPLDKYYASHPEYYSLVKGKRIKDNTQLCCTNPEVVRICTESVLELMRSQKENTVFSVSQNDWDNHCECDKCQALAKAEDSQMAPVLQLVNQVAAAVEKEFPDKIVETLAYQWTRRPPKTMRPHPKVIVMLCSIECCFSHPLATCDHPFNKSFRKDLQGWSKICDRLWIWDYVTDFAAYLTPFPNQRVRNDNIQFFVANHVKGIFEQDTYETPHSEMAGLGGYMTAKFLWNPKYDENVAMNEYLEAYYGKAAKPIREYLDALHDYAEKKNIHVTIYVPPTFHHLTVELLTQADKLWQQAEDAVAAEPAVLKRVQLSRMSADYAIMERARIEKARGDVGDKGIVALAVKRFKPFTDTLLGSGMSRLHEGGSPADIPAYRDKLARDLGIGGPAATK
jgi:hypothetical protein